MSDDLYIISNVKIYLSHFTHQETEAKKKNCLTQPVAAVDLSDLEFRWA